MAPPAGAGIAGSRAQVSVHPGSSKSQGAAGGQPFHLLFRYLVFKLPHPPTFYLASGLTATFKDSCWFSGRRFVLSKRVQWVWGNFRSTKLSLALVQGSLSLQQSNLYVKSSRDGYSV